MIGILTFQQAVTTLLLVLPIGVVGAWLRRIVMRAYRRNITGWIALASGALFGLAITGLWWFPVSDRSITAAINLTVLSSVAAFLSLGALTLGRNASILVMGALYCLLALPVILATVFVLFALGWTGAHLDR